MEPAGRKLATNKQSLRSWADLQDLWNRVPAGSDIPYMPAKMSVSQHVLEISLLLSLSFTSNATTSATH